MLTVPHLSWTFQSTSTHIGRKKRTCQTLARACLCVCVCTLISWPDGHAVDAKLHTHTITKWFWTETSRYLEKNKTSIHFLKQFLIWNAIITELMTNNNIVNVVTNLIRVLSHVNQSPNIDVLFSNVCYNNDFAFFYLPSYVSEEISWFHTAISGHLGAHVRCL